jgi:hypothetical protein
MVRQFPETNLTVIPRKKIKQNHGKRLVPVYFAIKCKKIKDKLGINTVTHFLATLDDPKGLFSAHLDL